MKPCPFCGGGHLSIVEGNTYGGFYVICWTCITKGPRSDKSKEEAIELWEKRA